VHVHVRSIVCLCSPFGGADLIGWAVRTFGQKLVDRLLPLPLHKQVPV
jgi:hypothetical protein